MEGTIDWLKRCRPWTKNYENLSHSALGFLRLASMRFMMRNAIVLIPAFLPLHWPRHTYRPCLP